MNRKLKVDGNETTLREFIHANTEQDGQIELEEVLMVLNGKSGESFYIGLVEIEIL